MLTKKDIIALNQEFDTGTVINEASLDFAISYAKRTTNWPKALAFLVRAILLDHVFEEGNKRTAALLVKYYAELKNCSTNDGDVAKLVQKIVLKNIVDIIKIEEMIKDAIRKCP